MKPRERVFAALAHEIPDRIPRFEIWIDAFVKELGGEDEASVYVNMGQDCVLLPRTFPEDSVAWKTGVDELGRLWKDGFYAGGVVDSYDSLEKYSPSEEYAKEMFDPAYVNQVRERYPDHCHIFGTHEGPFNAAYMAMGFESFFTKLLDDPAFIHKLLEHRTRWCLAMFQEAIRLGAEVIVMGEDSAHNQGPMISPKMWEEHILQYHRQIVDELDVPVIWHSDGDIRKLLPFAVQAGFIGVHGLDPIAGIELDQIKAEFGHELVLIGNVDSRVLCGTDLNEVRKEVDRCVSQGAPGGGYMIASCNSIFDGMNLEAVAEMFKYQSEVGFY
jgi:uroporphyrinogen decarboxylase